MCSHATGLRPSCIMPPHILREIAQRGNPAQRAAATNTLALDATFRTLRASPLAVRPRSTALPAAVPVAKNRTIYTAAHQQQLPGQIVGTEQKPPTRASDVAAYEAFQGLGATWDFYFDVYGRQSIDDEGLPLDATVHFGTDYNNAFWNGRQMVFGDGDGELFNRFTIALDVIGHELTHGVTEDEAGLVYMFQPGALNESISDVFGSLIKQRKAKQTAAEADWLIGAGLFTSAVNGSALRSMKAPGTAYDDPVLGKDPQPDHMRPVQNTRPGQRRRPHQLGHPEQGFLPGGDRHGRVRMGEGRADLVRDAPRLGAAHQHRVQAVRQPDGRDGDAAVRTREPGTDGRRQCVGNSGDCHHVGGRCRPGEKPRVMSCRFRRREPA